jgi:hypothetical protein
VFGSRCMPREWQDESLRTCLLMVSQLIKPISSNLYRSRPACPRARAPAGDQTEPVRETGELADIKRESMLTRSADDTFSASESRATSEAEGLRIESHSEASLLAGPRAGRHAGGDHST